MRSICEMNFCDQCSKRKDCGGCIRTDGHPFGGECVAAEAIKRGGFNGFLREKNTLIDEVNALQIKGLRVEDLNLLNGFYVNLEYQLANGQKVKLLEDNHVYWGNQVEIPGSDRCYGVAADDRYLLVCEYGCEGKDPQIILYQKRQTFDD